MELFAEVFRQKGFCELKVNVPNIMVFVNRAKDKDYIAILFHMPNGVEWSKEQCVHVEKQLLEKLQANNPNEVQLITFICTYKVDLIRDIYRQNDHTVVIDLEENRLLVFEGMDSDEFKLYPDIEKILQSRNTVEDDQNSSDLYSNQIERHTSKKQQIINGLKNVGYANSVIIGLNVLVFILLTVTNTYDSAVENGKIYWIAVNEYHEYYRLFTCMFLHGGASHLLNNMLILAVIGGILEKRIGKIKYCILYLLSGLIAGIVSLSVNTEAAYSGSIGASGAIFGVVGAVLWMVLINKGRVENLGRRQMFLFIAFSLYGGFTNQGVDNAAHIGGLIGGFILAILIYRKPKRRDVIS